MQCPGCGLYHPSRYEQCVSCGAKLAAGAERSGRGGVAAPARSAHSNGDSFNDDNDDDDDSDEDDDENEDEDEDLDDDRDDKTGRNRGRPKPKPNKNPRRGQDTAKTKGGFPTGVGIAVAAVILLGSAGGTYFFLSRPPEHERLLQDGQKQLSNGQYAFALKTLEHASALKPSDGKVLLALARAYIGVDQVEKAWQCITMAQQNGISVASNPQLAQELSNYYRQRNQFDRAVELIRPLADQNLPGQKAALADLSAHWGDESFRQGDSIQALQCWEEVKELKEGSRFTEADTRLSSILQKLIAESLTKGDDNGALNYLNRLNVMAPNPQNFEKTAELYGKQGKLDLAIDQLKQAVKLGSSGPELNSKLASLMAKRGKELLDKGDAGTGYAYLQQAQGLDNKIKVPTVTVRGITVSPNPTTGQIRITGSVWNPGPHSISYLSLKADLFDSNSSSVLWSREQHLVDEFVPPLGQGERRGFEMNAPDAPRNDGSVEVRLYLDGSLYKSYPIGSKTKEKQEAFAPPPIAPDRRQPDNNVPSDSAIPSENPLPQTPPEIPPSGTSSPEERTLRDLD